VSGFALSCTANKFIHMILYDFCLLSAQFCCIIIRMMESRMQIADRCQGQSYFTTDGLPPVSSSWRQAPSDFQQRFFQVNPCGNYCYVTSSLTRRWVYLLRICLTFHQLYISHIYHVIENSSFCTQIKSKSKLCYDRWSVSIKAPIWGSRLDLYYW
jgi:hypothetical protein